jgi:hypothetical protein
VGIGQRTAVTLLEPFELKLRDLIDGLCNTAQRCSVSDYPQMGANRKQTGSRSLARWVFTVNLLSGRHR